MLPTLEAELGPGVAEALARTAALARDDADLLDVLAAEATRTPPPTGVSCWTRFPAALRRRVLGRWLRRGTAVGDVAGHVHAVEALITDWHGQRGVDLPGGSASGARGAAGGGVGSPSTSLLLRNAPEHVWEACAVDDAQISGDLTRVLYTKEQIIERISEVAAQIDLDYEGKELLLVGVLNGAVMVMADLSRALKSHCRMDWMAISSYGSGTQSSGVVRILKDLNTDISGMHVLVVEDIIDTGLTLSYLIGNLMSRNPASLKIMTTFRKPEAAEERGRRGVRGLRHPERVRGRVRPRLRRSLSQPDIGRHVVSARLQLRIYVGRGQYPKIFSEYVQGDGLPSRRASYRAGRRGEATLPPRAVPCSPPLPGASWRVAIRIN